MEFDKHTGIILLDQRDKIILDIEQDKNPAETASELVVRAVQAHKIALDALMSFYLEGIIPEDVCLEDLEQDEAIMNLYSTEVANTVFDALTI